MSSPFARRRPAAPHDIDPITAAASGARSSPTTRKVAQAPTGPATRDRLKNAPDATAD